MAWTEKLRSGKWQGKYRTPDGKVKSAGSFPHKAKALREAGAAEAEARKSGWRNPESGDKLWGDWVTEWWPTRTASEATLKKEISPLEKYLRPRWGDVPLNRITRHDIKAWVADMLRGEQSKDDPDEWVRKPLAPSTVLRYFCILGVSLTAAVDAELIDYDPSAGIKIPKGETDDRRFLTHAEAEALLNAFGTARDLAIVMTLLGTGMRWGEAMGIQIPSVDFTAQRIRIADTWVTATRSLKPYPKGRRIRYVPLPEWLQPSLQWAIAGRTSGFLFGEPEDIDNWRKRVWDKAVTASGIGVARIHDLRHTYASWRLQSGTPLAEVGQLLGHADWKTTQRYAHLEDAFTEQVRASVEGDGRMVFAWQRAQVGASNGLHPMALAPSTSP